MRKGREGRRGSREGERGGKEGGRGLGGKAMNNDYSQPGLSGLCECAALLGHIYLGGGLRKREREMEGRKGRGGGGGGRGREGKREGGRERGKREGGGDTISRGIVP